MPDTSHLHIQRPVPRRPFFEIGVLSPDSPPPPDDPPFRSPYRPYTNDGEQRSPAYLDPQAFNPPMDSSSRASSYRALTSSTLSGIYSQADIADGYPGTRTTAEVIDSLDAEDSYRGSLPVPGPVDPRTHKLMEGRRQSMLGSRRRSSGPSGRPATGFYQSASPQSLGLRTGVLFLLGMGYGAFLTRLSTEQQWASFPVEGILRPGYDGRFLAAWGFCGVVLGSLLPWFDGKWEEAFENKDDGYEDAVKDEEDMGTDWALVVRGIGAFAGIVFAIRKVPWASTMQVSLTLAMVNPFLWYLIDRSKSGFLLSAGVGLAGSIVLMGLNPEIMPTPKGYSSAAYLRHNHTGPQADGGPLMLGGLATQRTVETGIWMLSVLFCSCVCFGNIGRRLAFNRSAAGRGRWGGLR